MADNVTDTSNKEQSGFVLRYTIRNNILEQLYECVDYKCVTRESVCRKVVWILEYAQLSVSDCQSQTNDGAWNMAVQQRSCAAQCHQLGPVASYFHCAFHDHNLKLAIACNINDIQRMFNVIKNLWVIYLSILLSNNYYLRNVLNPLIELQWKTVLKQYI